MGKTKVAVSLDINTLQQVDHLVTLHVFPSRSRAIEEAVQEKLNRITHTRLARECVKLDPAHEKALAEEGMGKDISEWPEY